MRNQEIAQGDTRMFFHRGAGLFGDRRPLHPHITRGASKNRRSVHPEFAAALPSPGLFSIPPSTSSQKQIRQKEPRRKLTPISLNSAGFCVS